MQNGDPMQEFEFEHTCSLPISEGCQDTSRQAMYLKQSTFSLNLTSPIPEGTHSSWNFQPGSFIIVCYGLWLSTAHSKAPIKTKASIKAETIRSHETSPKRPEPTNWMRATVLSNATSWECHETLWSLCSEGLYVCSSCQEKGTWKDPL